MSISRFHHTPQFLLVALFGLMSSGGWAEDYRAELVISEVVFLPANTNEPAQIELFNAGDKSVDASGWCLCDKDGFVFVFPSLPLVPPGAFIVVRFGSPEGRGADVLTFADNVAKLECRAGWADRAFRGKENECALYSGSDQTAEELQDYVRWGRRPSSDPAAVTVAQAQAVQRKLWIAGYGVYVADPAPGDLPAVEPGGGIAWRPSKGKGFLIPQWFINEPRDVSIGSLNPWPTPKPAYPQPDLCVSLEGKMKFGWRGKTGDKVRFRLQIARDEAFNAVILEQETEETSVAIDMQPGLYHWRVRQESDNETGRWTSPIVFRIREIEPSRKRGIGDAGGTPQPARGRGKKGGQPQQVK